MKKYVLDIAGHSATLKIEPTGSKDTGIFFPPDLIDFLGGMENLSFIVYKDDCISAMASIIASLPLYSNKGGAKISHTSASEIHYSYMKMISEFFGDGLTAIYTDFQPSETTQARRYLFGLEKKDKGNFSIRKFLIANFSTLTFIVDDENQIHLRVKTNVVSANQADLPAANAIADISEKTDAIPQNDVLRDLRVYQKIFYGAPGTGKSFKIDNGLFKDMNGEYIGIKKISEDRKFRTTFHPDYDYAQFVGAYKPKKEGEKITYSFVPQVFAKAYIKAWEEYLKVFDGNCAKEIYLVIEEINRGNCAQVFGDIFQLLDRTDGHSDYPINIDADFSKYIKKQLSNVKQGDGSTVNYWSNYKNKIQEWGGSEQGEEYEDDDFCKIALPSNFNILATMNTSDQSLFPMDSAFKRRFDWEYVPINYDHPKAHFVIKVGDTNYDWLDFLEKINENIEKVTKSEDKKLGEFFIKPKDGKTIDLEEFRSKVLFYLWDSVYKDEDGNTDAEKVFHFNIEDGKKDKMTFQKLFDREKGVQYVSTIMGKDHLNVDQYKENDTPVTDSQHSSETTINTDTGTAEETTDDTAEPAQT